MRLISPKLLVVFDDFGTHSFSLAPDESAEVPDQFVPDLMKLGATIVGAAPVVKEPVDNSKKVAAIADAMRTIMGQSDLTLLDDAGLPRVSEIDALLDFRSNQADRAAAWATVEE